MNRSAAKRKVSPTTTNPGAPGIWSDKDNAALQRVLDPLRKPPAVNIFGFLGSEARALACAPRSEVHDRTMSFLSSLNVMAGLVLSAIAPMATTPLDSSSLPSGKRWMADLFNVFAYVSVTTQICIVM